MQDTPQDRPEAAPDGAAPLRRRGMMWWLGWTLALVFLLALAGLGGLWIRLNVAPLALPEAVRAQIEARLDAAMPATGLSLGAASLDLPEGGRAPVVELRDIRVSDASGAPRAAFPALRVHLDPGPILSGQVRPRRIEIAGAALRLSRDAAGRVDLDLSGGGGARDTSLPASLARLDAMFALPEFAALEAVTASGLDLSMADAMTGQTLRIDDATARLTRGGGQLTLTVGGLLSGSRETRLDIALLRRASAAETEIAVVFADLAARDLATAGPALAWLDLMRAPISGRLALGLGDDGTLGGVEARLDIGAGRVQLAEGAAPLGFDRIAADMVYDPVTRRIGFPAVRLEAGVLGFAAQGHADVAPGGASFVGQFRLSDIAAAPEGMFSAPLSIDGAALDFRLTLAPEVRVELADAVVFDDALRLRARGTAEARDGGLALAFDAEVPEIALGALLDYWPEAAIPGTRTWIAENMDAARLRGVDLAVRATPGNRPELALQADLTDVTMRPLRDGPPVRDAQGFLDLMDDRLVLHLDRATLAGPAGGVELGGSSMVVEDLTQRPARADYRIAARGGLRDTLEILAGPPFNVFEQGAMTPERIGTGEIALLAQFRGSLERRETPPTLAELGLGARAEITGFASDTLVPGRSLTAERLGVTLVPEALAVTGAAVLDGVPVSGTWQRALGPDAPRLSTFEGRAALDRERLAAFGIPLGEGVLSGQGTADLRLDLPDGAPGTLRLDTDLAGLALSVPAIGWRLGAAETGALSAELELGPAPRVRALSLEAPGLLAQGDATLRPGGGLERLELATLRAGAWLDVNGEVLPGAPGTPPAIEITGGRVSLDRAPPLGQGGTGTPGPPLSVRLDRLEIGQGLALTDLEGSFDTGGGLTGEFQGLVNGAAPVTGLIEPGRFGPGIRVLASDGGAVMRAAGIFRRAHGGRMVLNLQALETPRSYDGALLVEGPRLRDAPAMAELLNLISVVGLLEQLSGEGINLGTVEARFTLTPQRLTLTEGTALGNALGISMDGVYDIPTRRYEMQGVVSPLYMVNGLVGALFAPRREGLFGFSYQLTGTAENSSVAVNPLSILTPGIFRDIFRRPPPELRELEQQTP